MMLYTKIQVVTFGFALLGSPRRCAQLAPSLHGNQKWNSAAQKSLITLSKLEQPLAAPRSPGEAKLKFTCTRLLVGGVLCLSHCMC